MTTPQADLYRISEMVRRIESVLLGDENHVDIQSSLTMIAELILTVAKDQEKLQDQMNLIIKLLSKSDSHG